MINQQWKAGRQYNNSKLKKKRTGKSESRDLRT